LKVDFVGSCALKYGHTYHVRELEFNQRSEVGLQDRARKWRKKESEKLISDKNNQPWYIVTAHHENDQLENMMLKLLRGSHISNLQMVSHF